MKNVLMSGKRAEQIGATYTYHILESGVKAPAARYFCTFPKKKNFNAIWIIFVSLWTHLTALNY